MKFTMRIAVAFLAVTLGACSTNPGTRNQLFCSADGENVQSVVGVVDDYWTHPDGGCVVLVSRQKGDRKDGDDKDFRVRIPVGLENECVNVQQAKDRADLAVGKQAIVRARGRVVVGDGVGIDDALRAQISALIGGIKCDPVGGDDGRAPLLELGAAADDLARTLAEAGKVPVTLKTAGEKMLAASEAFEKAFAEETSSTCTVAGVADVLKLLTLAPKATATSTIWADTVSTSN